jgi:membrane-bound lytic murein transglycosylase A
MIAQDVGHAIKGGIRGDIFFGHGRLAARRAGLMKQQGRYYILLPKAAPEAS